MILEYLIYEDIFHAGIDCGTLNISGVIKIKFNN